jgi:dolichol-phosphate mannosyltransferase
MIAPPQSDGPRFCVIIPMFNEQAGAEACVTRVSAELAKLGGHAALVVVNDGSSDKTHAILERLHPQFEDFHLLEHDVNQGYGAALRTGIAFAIEAGFDYCLFMDSDLTNDPADLGRFAAEMEKGTNVIKASRFVKGGGMQGVPWRRAAVSRLGNWMASFLFRVGVRDCTNGFRAVKTSILAQMQLTERGFPIIVEELYQSVFLAQTFAEIPVMLTNRADTLRLTSFTYDAATMRKYLGYALKAFLRLPPKQKTLSGEPD